MIEFERNVSKIKIQDKPFPYFFLDDAIDIAILDSFKKDVRKFEHLINLEEHTESLSPVFREGEPRGHLIGLGARSAGEISDSVFLKALDEHSSSWVLLKEYFTSDSFFKKTLDIFFSDAYFEKNIMTRFGFIKLKPRLKGVNYKKTILDFLLRRDFHLSVRFSRYTNNAGTTIHRDNSLKALSFLLYLDTADWAENFKGGFSVYDNSNARDLCGSQHYRLSPENEKKLILHEYIEYKENRLVGFCNTSNSWHQAPPTELAENIYRDCFQVNLFMINEKRKDLEVVFKIAVYFRNIIKKVFGIGIHLSTK